MGPQDPQLQGQAKRGPKKPIVIVIYGEMRDCIWGPIFEILREAKNLKLRHCVDLSKSVPQTYLQNRSRLGYVSVDITEGQNRAGASFQLFWGGQIFLNFSMPPDY